MTDSQFEYLLGTANELDKKRTLRVIRSFVWRLKHPRISKWLDAAYWAASAMVPH